LLNKVVDNGVNQVSANSCVVYGQRKPTDDFQKALENLSEERRLRLIEMLEFLFDAVPDRMPRWLEFPWSDPRGWFAEKSTDVGILLDSLKALPLLPASEAPAPAELPQLHLAGGVGLDLNDRLSVRIFRSRMKRLSDWQQTKQCLLDLKQKQEGLIEEAEAKARAADMKLETWVASRPTRETFRGREQKLQKGKIVLRGKKAVDNHLQTLKSHLNKTKRTLKQLPL